MNRASPFPGMDPWLERSWGDIHATLITYMRDALNGVLPARLAARSQERVFIEAGGEDMAVRRFLPDVRVVEYPHTGIGAGPAVAVAEPGTEVETSVVYSLEPVDLTESFIEILDFASNARIVTLIELVSMSNKLAGEGREKYLQKQAEARAAGVNVVEIDLLRAGRDVTLAAGVSARERSNVHYHASIYRAATPTRLTVFPIHLYKSLPVIPVPLRPGDADVTIRLQDLLQKAYVEGRYDLSIDYTKPPEPRLSPQDEQWVRSVLAARTPVS